SASLMEQLASGTAIVASDNGCRAELPEGAVVKVSEGDAERRTEALRRLVADEKLRSSVGLEGWRFAMSQTVELAAADYVRFLEEAPHWKPALDLADRVGKELSAMGVTTASPSLRRISPQIASIGLRRGIPGRSSAGRWGPTMRREWRRCSLDLAIIPRWPSSIR